MLKIHPFHQWALLIAVPLMIFVATDFAICSYKPHWQQVVREVPPQAYDTYRNEGLLRTLAPGRHNVLIVGDSTAEASVDVALLERIFAPQQLTFTVLSIGGAATVNFGLLANSLAGLDPGALLIFTSPYTVRSRNFYPQVYTYDIRTVADLFTAHEGLDEWRFHVAGIASQTHVLIRHRHAMQRFARIQFGFDSWDKLALEKMNIQMDIFRNKVVSPIRTWVKDRRPTVYPNPNTRAIELLGRHLDKRQVQMLVVEAPTHPFFNLMLGATRINAFRDYMETLVIENNMSFLPEPRMLSFSATDFKDQTHLNTQGRAKFTQALIPHLQRVLGIHSHPES